MFSATHVGVGSWNEVAYGLAPGGTGMAHEWVRRYIGLDLSDCFSESTKLGEHHIAGVFLLDSSACNNSSSSSRTYFPDADREP